MLKKSGFRRASFYFSLPTQNSGEPKFVDPASWNAASYNAHPIDSIEPLPDRSSLYRDEALRCMRILRSVDRCMSRAKDPRLCWTIVSIAIGLDSTAGLSETQICRQPDLSDQSLHRATARFAKLANLDPAGKGLRSFGQFRSTGEPPTTKTARARFNGSASMPPPVEARK
jgi:hypothetical protein